MGRLMLLSHNLLFSHWRYPIIFANSPTHTQHVHNLDYEDLASLFFDLFLFTFIECSYGYDK